MPTLPPPFSLPPAFPFPLSEKWNQGRVSLKAILFRSAILQFLLQPKCPPLFPVGRCSWPGWLLIGMCISARACVSAHIRLRRLTCVSPCAMWKPGEFKKSILVSYPVHTDGAKTRWHDLCDVSALYGGVTLASISRSAPVTLLDAWSASRMSQSRHKTDKSKSYLFVWTDVEVTNE